MAGERPVRLVVDSLSTIMTTAERTDILRFNISRLRFLRSRCVLTLDSFVTKVLDGHAVNGLRHAYPMIVYMRYVTTDGVT